ncbi:MAG: hypothetical protein A2019_09585 [Sulfurimonas sp. GWF2_37_8]|nr:MAG: hypothetical protein A2019_09585 [Sulfurimonas sp. GWF2_37_8]
MKNQEFLLEAFYISKTKLKLILIGSSVLKDYLNYLKSLKMKFDKEYGFKEVEFLLDVSREETLKYLQNATLFLHSSKLEVFPMVILEAMAKGIPYICTKVGNVETLHGGVSVDNRAEMALSIDNILKNEEYYNRVVLEGVASMEEEYNWQKIVQNLIQKIGLVQ